MGTHRRPCPLRDAGHAHDRSARHEYADAHAERYTYAHLYPYAQPHADGHAVANADPHTNADGDGDRDTHAQSDALSNTGPAGRPDHCVCYTGCPTTHARTLADAAGEAGR